MTDLQSPPTADPAVSSPRDAQDAAAALIAANRRRRTARRWIAAGSVPVVLAALLLVGKLLSMYAFAYQSIASYVGGDNAGSVRAAQGLDPLNWFEPYKAPFDQGVGLAAGGDLPEGQAKFEEALGLARGLEVCDIRVNLALVLEWRGDAASQAGDAVGAAEFYGRGLTVTAETPEECRSPEAQQQSSDPERDMSETLDELSDRLQEKQQRQQEQEQQGQPDQPQEQEPEQQQPDQSDLDDLQDRLEQGERERQQNQQDQGDDGGSGGTEKPW
ncbi:hypothetical protein K8F61_12975 [Microbacterium resistens]|uniref:Tetratricopeptide repeat protein n=1 Tax=Microbacterium resistens TaxID=156977 RepID=A0ABY3RNR5_9MICO|nr:hypothetical protein [Microbacterium resistens]UGS25584.1 hypothetical protein K8F61_12975 [Microbacterium resistens]